MLFLLFPFSTPKMRFVAAEEDVKAWWYVFAT